MTPNELLNTFLKENRLMQLATQADGKLWICNVYFVSDQDHNIYWISSRQRRHSIEIEDNPVVAATVAVDQNKMQAVQISGKAYRIPADKSEHVHKIYGEKLKQKNNWLEDVRQDTPQSLAYWVLKPEIIEIWDEANFPDSPKQRI